MQYIGNPMSHARVISRGGNPRVLSRGQSLVAAFGPFPHLKPSLKRRKTIHEVFSRKLHRAFE